MESIRHAEIYKIFFLTQFCMKIVFSCPLFSLTLNRCFVVNFVLFLVMNNFKGLVIALSFSKYAGQDPNYHHKLWYMQAQAALVVHT